LKTARGAGKLLVVSDQPPSIDFAEGNLMFSRAHRNLLRVFFLSIAAGMFVPQASSGATSESHRELVKTIPRQANLHGGLIVHVGCGDGALTAGFGEADGFLVQGLERSEDEVVKARKFVQGQGLYGKVSIKQWQGEQLPYVDNLVSLLVIEGDSTPSRQEVLRVLRPEGVAVTLSPQSRHPVVKSLVRKPRPEEMDDWTHYMYNPTGNAVSRDTMVAPPEHLQWVAGPRWGRHHDHMASTSAMVSAGGRVFHIFDEGSTASIMLPAKWRLIARDAFNGVVLWKREIPTWWTHFMPLKSGPAQLPRLLVASGDHVFVTLGRHEPISKLDAATGETIKTYPQTKDTWEIIRGSELLYAVTGSPRNAEEVESRDLYSNTARAPGNPINMRWKDWDRKLLAVDPESGATRWQVESKILPGTLAADAETLYFHNGTGIVAVDKSGGEKRWTSKPVAAIDLEKGIPTGYMPSLVVDSGVVVFAGGRGYDQHMKGTTLEMVGLSAATGEVLWSAPHYTSGYQSPEDLLVVDKTVVTPFSTWLKPNDPKNNHIVGFDLMTGKPAFDNNPDVGDPVWFIHARCHPSKATVNYLLMSREGVEFVDVKTRKWKIHHWVRGECLYGIMPANGLLYAPMHECACSADMKISGLNALAAPTTRSTSSVDVAKYDLTKGPAFGKVESQTAADEADWPTFRHDATRSGVASCPAPTQLEKQWSTKIEGKLSAPVVAHGRLYVAAIDQHTLYVLDEGTGQEQWTFTAEGRIDSPPTIYNGMVLFGSRDGCVYCLRATDGATVWRFRAVSEDLRLTAFDQVESVWPIHGNILIREGDAWFVAGRSSFLDGGLQMYRLNPATGEVLSHATFDGKTDDGGLLTGAEEKRLVGLPDVLSASEDGVFMRAGVFRLAGDTIERRLLPSSKVIRYGQNSRLADRIPGEARDHLFSSYGFLDDSWFHRSYWIYGDVCSHRHNYSNTGRGKPAGRLLVFDDKNVYGFGRLKKYFSWTTPMEYRIFAETKQAAPKLKGRGGSKPLWETNVPILASGLTVAGDTLFAAGSPDVLDETTPGIRAADTPALRDAIREQVAALDGQRGGILIAVSKTDGAVEERRDLDSPPVFDGLIAANGRLYVALKDGSVQCWK
jgi:outer membrane protein assembly factor BamB